MYRHTFAFVICATLLTGCGQSGEAYVFTADTVPGSSPEDQSAPEPGSNDRKIVYVAQLELAVDNLDEFSKLLRALVTRSESYISSSNNDRMRGDHRSAVWTLRIPVPQYELFMENAARLGTPESQNENAADVTAEFVDLTARIANKRKLEQRIVALLEKPDGTIKEVIEVERELGRVREEVERLEGKLRLLNDQASLATVTIRAREDLDYVPAENRSLGQRVAAAWSGSVSSAKTFLENVLVTCVGYFLAAVFWLAILFAAWLTGRRFLQDKPTAKPLV